MKKYFLMIFLLRFSSQNCKVGCLMCEDQKCIYCDEKQNYYRVGQICTKKVIQRCLYSDNGETCNQCDQGFFTDFSTGKCTELLDTNLVENCRLYMRLGECSECSSDFFLSNNTCISVANKITDCEEYSSKETCSKCKEGMRFQDKACVAIPFENCMSVGDIQCNECEEGYMLYQNAYLFNFNVWNADKKKKMDIYSLDIDFYSICAKQNIANCLEYEKFYQCKKCEENYFLNPEKTCQAIPEEKIENCKEYLKYNFCRLCMEGYYLVSKKDENDVEILKDCRKHEIIIANCKQMSETVKDNCQECSKDYYLESNNCVKRIASIQFCTKYAIQSDTCQECEQDYSLNQENTACFPLVEHCHMSQKGAFSIICNQCNPQYFFQQRSQKCISIQELKLTESFDNCQYFEEFGDSLRCTECLPKYYLDSEFRCQQHSSFIQKQVICNQWSPNVKNKCDSCSQDEFKLSALNYCEYVDIQYQDSNNLYYKPDFRIQDESIFQVPIPYICKDGFQLKMVEIPGSARKQPKCFQIIIEFCKSSKDGSECLECQSTDLENYFLSAPGGENKCIQSYDYVIRRCNLRNDVELFKKYNVELRKLEFFHFNACHGCLSPYYPVYFKEAQFCILKNTLLNNYTMINSATNGYSMNLNGCKVFDVGKNQCRECEAIEGVNMILSTTFQCMTSCVPGTIIMTNYYPLSANNSQINYESNDVKFFFCQDLKIIGGCHRVSAIPDREDAGFVDFQAKCMQCTQNNQFMKYLPLMDQSLLGAYKYVDKYAYLPTKATNHFKSQNLSFKSPYEQVIAYNECQGFDSERMGAQFNDEVEKYNFALETYKPIQPDYRETSDFWQTCKAVGPLSNAKSFCIACNFGFYGYFLPLSDNLNNFMIPQCKLFQQCEYGTYITGLTSQYVTVLVTDDASVSTNISQRKLRKGFANFWVTCHVCKVNPNNEDEVKYPKIPTFTTSKIGKTKDTLKLWSSILNQVDFIMSEAKDDFYPSNFCAVPGFVQPSDTQYLNNSGVPVNVNFPQNCGVQHIIHDKKIKLFDSTEESNPYCIACKPGYKPVIKTPSSINDINSLIINCVQISHCDMVNGATTFNKCTQCLEGYALNMTDDECLAFSNKLCYKGNKVTVGGQQVEKCLICNKGMVPDRDQKYCNDVEIQNCLTQSFFSFNSETKTFYTLDSESTSEVIMMKGQGCLECDLGYIAVNFEREQKTCVKSSEIENRVEGIGIHNCFIYESYDACSKCNVGFITAVNDKTQCILSSQIENCSTYRKQDGKFICIKCIEKFLLDSQRCVNGDDYITNCLEFEFDEVNLLSDKQRCSKCDTGFVAVENGSKKECYQANLNIDKCLEFEILPGNKRIRCNLCQPGYFQKYFYKEEVVLTHPENVGIQAKQATFTASNINANIESELAYFALDFCLKIPLTPNCKQYSQQGNSECILCEDSYYLSEPKSNEIGKLKKCVLRQSASYPNCHIIDKKSDSCVQCLDSYYVRNNQCSLKPNGVIGCVDYSDSDTCIKCRNNAYVLGNTCRTVTSDLIDKCLYYKSEKECMECENRYLLIGNKCKAILISNCQSYLNERECLICLDQFFLTEQKTCIEGQVGNCLLHASLTACQQCKNNHFVNNLAQCQAVSETVSISNCEFYKSSTECMKCTNKTVLAKDGKSCLAISKKSNQALYKQLDLNCKSYSFETNCRVCASGYKFYEGKCSKCSQNVQNCHFCDYKDDTKCHVCMSKFYQDSNTCVSSGETTDEINVGVVPKKNWEYFSKDVKVFGRILILLGIFVC